MWQLLQSEYSITINHILTCWIIILFFFFGTRSDGDGGCALFVHSSLRCKIDNESSNVNVNILTVAILDLGLNITVVYKQPLVAISTFEEYLEKCFDADTKSIIVGDIYINLY